MLGSLMTALDGDVSSSYEYNDWVTTNYGDPNDDVRRFQFEADALPGLQIV